MKCLTLFISLVLYPILAHAVPQPYPIDIDSRARTAPSLEMNQGEPYTVRVTFKSGATNEDVSAAVPFMYWALTAYATNYVTSSWARVDGGTGGVVDFTFSAAALNTNGDLIYGVGANQTFRQGALRVRANPFTSGVASPMFSLSTNLLGWSFVNYPWIDGASITGANSNSVSVSGNSLLITVRTNFGTSDAIAPDLTALSNGVARAVTNAGTRVNGSPLTNGAALLVGTVREIVGTNGVMVSQGSGPITIISAAAMLTNATGAGRLTLGISGQTVTGAVDVSGLATGAPIYSLAGYATGTPVYTTAGLATGTPLYVESDPVFVAASNALLTKAQAVLLYATGTPVYAVSGLGTDTTARAWAVGASNRADAAYAIAAAAATGTPLYVESNLSALSNGVANATATGSLALAWAQAGSNLAAQGISAVVASNSFVKQNGDIITGGLDFTNGAPARFMNGGQAYWYSLGPGTYPVIIIDADNPSVFGVSNPVISFFRSVNNIAYLTVSTNGPSRLGPLSRAHGDTTQVTNWVDLWDGATLPDPRNLSAGTNAPAAWTAQPSLLALSNGLAAASALGTNAQITASNAQTTASAATNLAIALSASATNGLLAIGAVATNGQQTASNALATAQAAQVQASNINAAAWSQIATGAVSMATNRINQISAISFVNNATIGDIDYGLLFTNGYPAYAQGSSRYSFYGTWNFSPSSYQTAAAQASYATNAIKLFAGIVTQNQITARNQAFFDGTNIWIGLGGTNSLRMGGVLNAY